MKVRGKNQPAANFFKYIKFLRIFNVNNKLRKNMDFDALIIGAGVVGLAAAEKFSRQGKSVLLIEKENRIGTGVSSRNSEVIHAGIYYPKGSLKSKLCIEGKHLLYDWCAKHHVNYANMGKYIIAASEEELCRIESIKATAEEAGCAGLVLQTKEEIETNEPEISCFGGLFSPTSGIVSAHDLMDSFKTKAEEQGTDFLFNSKVATAQKNSQSTGYLVDIIDSTEEPAQVEVGAIVNCAGLYADEAAKTLGIDDESYKQKFVKGNYFRLSGKRGLFKKLIYPVPMPKLHGLGVHITLGLDGAVKFGPDVEFLPSNIEDYSVNESRKEEFYRAIKKYFPAIKPEELEPEMAGIRPKLAADNNFNDFIINEESLKGFPGIVNCVGIESPGLTSSIAIAELIYNKLYA